jgi:Cation efflux family
MFGVCSTGSKQRMKSGARRSTRRTVLIAGAANIFVAVIKLAAGLMTGSSAMLAEAAHSVADTLNQAFLLASVHQAARPADRRHPFGYGQERYFWSLLAAFGIFIAGAGFSFFEGILALGRTGGQRGLLVPTWRWRCPGWPKRFPSTGPPGQPGLRLPTDTLTCLTTSGAVRIQR